MTETLTPAVPADDWWAQLYDAAHGDTLEQRPAARVLPAPAGDRLPPPGQTVDLDKHPLDDDQDDDAADAFEEFDDSDELAEDDETDNEVPRERIAARLHPTRVREYLRDEHGDQQRRLRNLAYSGSAAGLGWGLGLVDRLHALLDECARQTGDPYAALVLGAGVIAAAVLLVDRRTRGWYRPLAWACRIPLASAVLALALYTPHTI